MIKLIAPRDRVLVKTSIKVDSLSANPEGINEGIIVDADVKTGLKPGQKVFFGKHIASIPVSPDGFIHLTMSDANIYAAWEETNESEIENVLPFMTRNK